MRLFESPLRSTRAAAVIAAALAALIYANAVENDFAYDDVHILVSNEAIQSLGTLPAALAAPYWPGAYGKELGLWRPGTTLLLGVQYAVWGENPVPYHLLNVLAHAAATFVLVFLLAYLMPLPGVFAAGVIFAVHPVHTEAVANVVGIAEIAPTIAYLLVCLAHVAGPARSSWTRALLSAFGFAVAFSFKESAITLPAGLFLLDAVRRDVGVSDLPRYLRDRWRLYLALMVAAGVGLWGRVAVLGTVASPLGPLGAELLQEVPRIWTLSEIWSHYVRLMVFPMDLAADYSPGVIPISLNWSWANAVGAVLALTILTGALMAWRRGPMSREANAPRAIGFGVVWFMITVSPVANVVFLSGVLLAERTLYLPSVGFAAAAGWLFTWGAGKGKGRRPWLISGLVLAASVGLMAARTWSRTPTWRDNDSVFLTLIRDYPQSGRSQWLLGGRFFRRGAPDRGVVAFREAVRQVGPHYLILTELGTWMLHLERHEAAVSILSLAHQEYPASETAPALLALAHMRLGQADEAERYARVVVAMAKDPIPWYNVLAWALQEQERWAEAADARLEALERAASADWPQWLAIAELRWRAGDGPRAAAALDSAARLAVNDTAQARVDSVRAALRGGAR
jgi:tetratricopeptide (TPR) repeat protein